MRSSNALLFLPQGPGVIAEGAFVTALVLRPLASPSAATSVHPSAAKLDATFSGAEYQSLATLLPAKVVAGSPVAGADSTAWRVIRTGLLTISDRASQGVYADESGPEMARLLGVMSADADWPLTINVVSSAIVPDDAGGTRSCIIGLLFNSVYSCHPSDSGAVDRSFEPTASRSVAYLWGHGLWGSRWHS
jgi:hypothetical protein